MEEGTQRAGEYSNNDIYFNAGTYAMNGGRGARHEQTKDLQPLSIYCLLYRHLTVLLMDKGPHTDTHMIDESMESGSTGEKKEE